MVHSGGIQPSKIEIDPVALFGYLFRQLACSQDANESGLSSRHGAFIGINIGLERLALPLHILFKQSLLRGALVSFFF